jgi:hypothetical protein
MMDLNFDCPYCSQNLEVPQDMGGETVECPACGRQLLVPVIEDSAGPAPVTGYARVSPGQAAGMLGQRLIHTPPERKGGLGMFLIGLVCFIIGTGLMWFMPDNIFICGPVLLLAFILSIIAMAQGSPGSGILLLLLVLIACTVGVLRHRVNDARAQLRATPAPRRQEKTAVRRKETPVINIGESTVIDGVSVTFLGVRYDTVLTKGMLGRSKRTDEEYMIVDVALENVADNRIIHLQNVWEKTKITDDLGNFENAKFAKTTQTGGVAGIFSAEMSSTSRILNDIIVFNIPVRGARYFTLEADPFFLERRSGSLIEISRSKLKLHFQLPARTQPSAQAVAQGEAGAEPDAASIEQEPKPAKTDKLKKISEADLMVEDWKWENAPDMSRLTIMGTVRNSSDRDFQNVKIYVSAQDGSGQLLGKTSADLQPAVFAADTTATFDLIFDNTACTTESIDVSFRFTSGKE